MGTEVLYPHDVLSQRLRPAPAAFLPRRKPHMAAAAANTNFNTNFLHRYGTSAAAAADCSGSSSTNPRTPLRKAEAARMKREVSPKAAAGARGSDRPVVMGQVTILKRGGSLDRKTSRSLDGKKKRAGGGGGDGGIVSSRRCGDLIVSGAGLLGPDPRMVPRLADRKVADAMYAGTGFFASPSPDNLPMPKFKPRKEGELAAVDLSATNDLRRLLRLG